MRWLRCGCRREEAPTRHQEATSCPRRVSCHRVGRDSTSRALLSGRLRKSDRRDLLGDSIRPMVWSCPACGREFGKRQSPVCVPALSIEGYFAARAPVEREIFEAVREHLENLGPLIVEPVGVGILFKRVRTFVELRPKARWVDLSFGLNHQRKHARITRTVRTAAGRTYHGIRITRSSDVDDQVREWLTESYAEFAG